ncbi:hypothetical protein VCHENC02_1040A, partial [Vibrio harveyi]
MTIYCHEKTFGRY